MYVSMYLFMYKFISPIENSGLFVSSRCIARWHNYLFNHTTCSSGMYLLWYDRVDVCFIALFASFCCHVMSVAHSQLAVEHCLSAVYCLWSSKHAIYCTRLCMVLLVAGWCIVFVKRWFVERVRQTGTTLLSS